MPEKGNASVSVNLADGSSTIISHGLTANGMLPVYISLNGQAGSLSGWLAFDTNDLTINPVNWFKNSAKSGVYSNGYSLAGLPLRLSPYVKGTNSLGTTNVGVLLAGGDLTNDLADVATLNVKTIPSGATNSVIVSLNLNTGIFAGTFVDPIDGKRTGINGVLVQAAQAAFGFFKPGDTASGSVQIVPHVAAEPGITSP